MILSSRPRERVAICLLLLLFLCAMIPGLRGFGGDVPLWGRWAGWNAEHGLPEAYGFLCTEMHERYAQPAAIFLTAYAFATRKWTAYILFSIACFLNLEAIMQWFGLPNYGTIIFDGNFVAGIYAAVIIILFRSLYRLRRADSSKNIA